MLDLHSRIGRIHALTAFSRRAANGDFNFVRLNFNVHFLGFINQRDIPGHYAMSDVFVLPSLYEPRGAVINEAFAQKYWPNEDPLEKRFRRARAGSPWITVVGVVANARTESLATARVPQIYLDVFQIGAKHLAIFLRGQLDAAAIPAEMREQLQAVDPTLPVFGAQTLDVTVSASLAERRFSMEMVVLFALTALLLAALGIYGVISYIVSERTHEFGIRLALGAQKRYLLSLVLRQGVRLALAGTIVGLVCALIVSRAMVGVLYGVRPTDPLTFGGVAILLIVVALCACYLPARRAIRVDPMTALRCD